MEGVDHSVPIFVSSGLVPNTVPIFSKGKTGIFSQKDLDMVLSPRQFLERMY